MFRLGEEVGGDVGRVAAAVIDHEDLARPGDHVDADLAEYQLLGGGNVDVSRPGDLVDPRDRGGAVGKSRNGLRSADAEDAVNAGEAGRHEHMGTDLAAGGGGYHDDFADPRHAGRNGVHDDTGGVTRLAARNVDADPRQRGNLLTQHDVRLFGGNPGLLLLFLVETGNPRDRQPERGDFIG